MKKTIGIALALCVTLCVPLAVFGQSQDFAMNGKALVKYEGKSARVTIPEGVTAIGERAFRNNSSLTSVTIPSSVTHIGNEAFAYCKSLTSITIPSSVTFIGYLAFSGCTNLTSITIPAGVYSIGFSAFYGCRSLLSITVDTQNNSYFSEEGVLFNKKRTVLIKYPEGKQESNYTIPTGVYSLDNVFHDCRNLISVTIPSSVTSIGNSPFSGCSSLTKITVDTQNPAYSSVDGVLFNKNRTVLVAYPAGKQERSYFIPSNVSSIGDWAFFGCSGITSVTIPSSVTSIGIDAFSRNRLTKISIGSNVTLKYYESISTDEEGKYLEDIYPFNNGFDEFYISNGSLAGTYTNNNGTWRKE